VQPILVPGRLGIRAHRVLVAASDASFAADFASLLQDHGFLVVNVCNGHDLQSEIEKSLSAGDPCDAFDLVVCDARLAGKTGLEVCAELRGCGRAPPFVFLAAPRDRFARAQARRLEAVGVLAKPVDLDGLSVFVRRAVT
jgi:CheY-like chemotaxis protein